MEKIPPLREATQPKMYERFRDALKGDWQARRLRTYFLPRCDFRKVYTYGAIYVCDRQMFLRERHERYKNHALDLRNMIRELEKEIWTEPIPSVALLTPATVRADHPADVRRVFSDLFSSDFAGALRKRQRLAESREQYHRVRRLLSTRQYGRADMSSLFLVREYLEWKARVSVEGNDLTAILRAVYVALEVEQPEALGGDNLLRKLCRFEKNCPEFVWLIRREMLNPPENIS